MLAFLCIELLILCYQLCASGNEKGAGDICDWFTEIFDFIPVVIIIHISSRFLNAVDVAEIVSDGLDVVN